MKTSRILIFAAAAAISMACAKENIVVPSMQNEVALVFNAAADTPLSRTMLADNGLEILWNAGDQIAVSGASTPFVADIAEGTSGSSADFTGNAVEADIYYAVYPASACSRLDGSNAVIDLKREQSAVKNTFDSEAGILTAMTGAEEMSFAFRHVVGYVKFTVDENSGDIVSVSVKASGGESLSGTFAVDCAAETPDLAVTDGSSTVSLVSEEPLEVGNYYIAMLPGTYSQGLEFTFTDAQGRTATKVLDGEISLEAGVVQNIGTVACLDGISTDIDERVIWEGETAMGNWEGYCQDLAWGQFDWNAIDPSSGICYLVIELEPDASSSYWTLTLRYGDAWENIPGIEDVEIAAGQTEVEIMLNQTALEDIQMNGGLVITGCFYTLRKVTLIQESVYTSEHEVWSGSHDLGTDWSSFLTLSWDKNVFQDITEGSILHVEYTESPDAGWYWQLQCNDGNWNILSSCGGETVVELASGDGTYSCELNDEDVASIRESGMVFNGYGIIIERIYWTK